MGGLVYGGSPHSPPNSINPPLLRMNTISQLKILVNLDENYNSLNNDQQQSPPSDLNKGQCDCVCECDHVLQGMLTLSLKLQLITDDHQIQIQIQNIVNTTFK